ncbi:myosin IC heavy chain-like [Prinia subflava]|uniref:myosin IC heavy chain-like n=1 Tax=Prinia subflava TaxID=208062 RepID=UPI002FDFC856
MAEREGEKPRERALSVWTPSHMRTGGSPPLFNISAPPKKSLQRSITAGGDPDSRHRGRDGPGRGAQPPPGCATAAAPPPAPPGGVTAGRAALPRGKGWGDK